MMFAFVREIWDVSRPHIWIYTVGSFLLGVQVAYVLGYDVSYVQVALYVVLLTLPINYFTYAVNDYFDIDTDAHNPKKTELESRTENKSTTPLLVSILLLLPLVGMVCVAPLAVQITAFAWLVIVMTYNAPPLRLKAIPVLDMFFAISFALWGVVGYSLFAGVLPPIEVFIPIVIIGCMMHLFTAVPDMEYDEKAGVITTAVWLGSDTLAIVVSAALCLTAIGWMYYVELPFVGLALVPYVVFFAYTLCAERASRYVFLYKVFLLLQYIVGFFAGAALLYSM